MRSAYDAVVDVTCGNDVLIPMRMSAVVALLDGQLTLASRDKMIDDLVEYARKFPNGLQIPSTEQVQPSQA